MTHQTVVPAVFHLEQAIQAIQKELETVPPFSIDKQTRMAEVAQLRDMIDRRQERRDRAAC